jgi:hypothetical protein
MKKCIWCSRTEDKTKFNNKAHTIPQSIGGTKICDNVCDECNSFFGQHNGKLPPIETVIKEAFNITRAMLLENQNEIGKNKTLSKFSSTYFNINLEKREFKLKPSYSHKKRFQENLSLQLRKGLYKIYLEEVERQEKNGHNEKYDFIREFCRYGIGEYPLFYFKRKLPVIVITEKWIKKPELFIDKKKKFKYLTENPSFFEFEILGHVFSIATSRYWELDVINYIKETNRVKNKFFENLKSVNTFNDIDFALTVFNK